MLVQVVFLIGHMLEMVDGKNIAVVVVEILKSGQVKWAHAGGVLDRPYTRHQVPLFPVLSPERKVCGLDEVFHSWQGLPKVSIDKITEREAVRQ